MSPKPPPLNCNPQQDNVSNSTKNDDVNAHEKPQRTPGGSVLTRLFSRTPRSAKTSGRMSTGKNNGKLFRFYSRSISQEEQQLTDMTDEELQNQAHRLNLPNNVIEFYHGDYVKAILHHRKTLEWRYKFDVDNILKSQPKNWLALKSECNTFLYGACEPVQSTAGKKAYIVVDKLVCTDITNMRRNNIKPEDLGNTIAFLEEYYQKKLYPKLYPEETTTNLNEGELIEKSTERNITIDDYEIYLIMDCKNVNLMKFISLDQLRFKNSQPIVLEEYYTGTIKKVLVINHPMVFQLFFTAIKQVFPKSFTDKFVFIRGAKDFVPYLKPEDVPLEYKGKNNTSVETAPDHLEFQEFLDSLPEKK